MKFTVNTSDLTKKLSVLSRIVSSSNVTPILGTILFFVGEELTLTSSDSEITIQTKIPIESDGESFSFTAPVKLLNDLLACCSYPTITMELVRGCIVVDVPNGQYLFPSMDANEFPSLPSLGIVSETILSANVFKQGIARTIFAMADDQLRPQMNGVCIEVEDSISFASTDAYRISWVIGDVIKGEESKFTISSKTANLFNSISLKGVEEVSFEVNAVNALFHVGEYTVNTRLVQGKFPNFKGVIPQGEMSFLTASKSELLSAIKRVGVFSNKSNSLIRFSVNGNITLSSEDLDMKHKATETLVCAYDGKPLEIGFKKDFLSEVISNIETEEVTMHLTAPNKPVLFDYEHVKLILMPFILI
jgi:DNA polymerase-3 subunit beta